MTKTKVMNAMMITLHHSLSVLMAAIFVMYLTTSVATAGSYGSYGKKAQNDIVDTAVSAGNFNTLLTAAEAAGLVDTLKGDGPFTLFAPTDDAFAAIPKEQLDALLKDKEALTKVLTYHLIKGKVTANDVMKLDSAQTLAGQSVSIDTSNGVQISNANVIKADIMTSNGVIHVIDKVMLPN